jgi:malonyl-ACP decarboxylase
MVLESEASARERSHEGLAEMVGASSVLDGTHLPEPCIEGEARAMQDALDAAGLSPQEIDYINAHGTSSPLGDRTECAAIRKTFAGHAGSVWINATKALTGHCISASGVLEGVACVLQIQGGFLHPNVNLERPIDRELRFVGPQSLEVDVEYALSNAFGFGGINSTFVFRRIPKAKRSLAHARRN